MKGRKYRRKEDGNVERNTFGEGESSFGDPSSVRKPESVSKASSLQLNIYSASGRDIEFGGNFEFRMGIHVIVK